MLKRTVLPVPLLLLFLILLAGTILVACVKTTGTSTAASQREPEPSTVEGTITFMERDGTVIIQPLEGQRRIVYIQQETKITRNGKPAQQADLKPGDQVWVSVGPMREALEMKATGP